MADESSNGSSPQADAFIRMWADFASRMAATGMAFDPESPPPKMARDMRDAALNAMSEQCDQFMRSPQFLDMIKQSLRTSIEMRKQFNDFLGKAHHDMQGASRQDIDQIMLGMRHIEQRMVDSVDRVDERLAAMEERLAVVEASLEKPARSRASKSRSTKKATSPSRKAPRKKGSRS